MEGEEGVDCLELTDIRREILCQYDSSKLGGEGE